jgi:hypothetical protein
MDASNVDVGSLMMRLNAQAMEIIRLRQLSHVVDDPWLIAILNLLHDTHAVGGTSVEVCTFNFQTSYGGVGRFRYRTTPADSRWTFGKGGEFDVTLDHMMAAIPKLCAMGLHVFGHSGQEGGGEVRERARLICPLIIRWGSDVHEAVSPPMVHHLPTGPCTMFDTVVHRAGDDVDDVDDRLSG